MLEPRLQRFVDFFNGLTKDGLDKITQIYAPDIHFIDPVHEIHGISALKHYLAHGYERLSFAEFVPQQGCIVSQQGFLSWQMQLQHPAIAKGKLITVKGCSELRFKDEKIIYHRDYYDLTEMVYQHLPLISGVTKFIKSKMASS